MLRGEAGIGKTALLDFLTESASQMAVARAMGVESEMELPYASLHQLCLTGHLRIVQVDDMHVVERRPAEHVVAPVRQATELEARRGARRGRADRVCAPTHVLR